MDSNPSRVKTKDYKIVVIILALNGVDWIQTPLGFYMTGVWIHSLPHSRLEWLLQFYSPWFLPDWGLNPVYPMVKTKDYKIVVIILAWNGVDYGFKPQVR
jgi:hypothetical protein